MENIYSFLSDGTIMEVRITHGTVIIMVKKWNDETVTLNFETCWCVLDLYSVGQSIAGMEIIDNDTSIDKVRLGHLENGSGSEQELEGIKKYSFISSWNENVLLEVYANRIIII